MMRLKALRELEAPAADISEEPGGWDPLQE
jgi:hypothetical protein